MIDPEVSVVMPLFNRAKYIAGAIKNVLNQTLKDIELIVVDDSRDNSTNIVQSFSDNRVTLIRNEMRKGGGAH